MADTTKLTLKLLVDKATNKVIFAEAGKEVVDVIFGLLQTPLGSIINLVRKEQMVGSIGNVFGSVETMNAIFLQSADTGACLLNPTGVASTAGMRLLLPPASVSSEGTFRRSFCYCGQSCSHHCAGLPRRQNTSTKEIHLLVDGTGRRTADSAKGYVKEMAKFTITDDLTVAPMDTNSIFTLLAKHKVTNVAHLEEKVVDFGFDEGVEMVRASLRSNTVLSDVFLGSRASFAVPKSEAGL